MAFFPTGLCKRTIFTVFHRSRSSRTRSELSYTRSSIVTITSPLKSFRQKFQKYYSWTSQQWNGRLMFCVIEDFDLVTKRSLAIDTSTCFNHRKRRSRFAFLSAGSSDEIAKFERVFRHIALRRHRANTASDSFALTDSTMTVTFPYQNDWKFLIYDLCCANTIHKTCDRVVKLKYVIGGGKKKQVIQVGGSIQLSRLRRC